ncbi:MAG: helix-turn-helix transcriptional regulator [Desulfitobacterium hafniense]|nr:helix-turn-helix transcriptional regulator [Desulfitobacterium hafniense]
MARNKYTEVERDKIQKMSNNLKRYLKSAGMTQTELSVKTGLAASTISDYVNGRTLISPSNLQKIADALDIMVDNLTGEALFNIIEDRVNELGISIPELSEKAEVPLSFLRDLESFVPWVEDYDYVIKIAKVLNLRPERLQAALSRLEPPPNDEVNDYDYLDALRDFSVIRDDESHPNENGKLKDYSFKLTKEEHLAVCAFIHAYRQLKRKIKL